MADERRASSNRSVLRRSLLVLAGLTLLGALAVAAPAGTQQTFPATIPLPNGFQPEGIAIGRGPTFYVGSIPTGAIYRGNLRTGQGAVLVQGGTGKAAIGLELDRRGRLFVAGGPTGKAWVYSASTGRQLAEFQLVTGQTFINDVVVTRTGAYFTDSVNQALYRVAIRPNGRLGAVTRIALTGDLQYQQGFNVNGIDATPNGKTLVLVQSNTGRLFTVNPTTGVTRAIDLGGQTVANGDGILLVGRTLYVVQNRNNQIAVVRLDARLRSGRIVRTITDSDFDVPTTIDDFGNRLYAVNARFGTPNPGTATYQVVQVRK